MPFEVKPFVMPEVKWDRNPIRCADEMAADMQTYLNEVEERGGTYVRSESATVNYDEQLPRAVLFLVTKFPESTELTEGAKKVLDTFGVRGNY